MKSESWKNKIQEYIHEHKLRKRWLKITASLGALAIVMTAAAMILPAITMENTPQMLECRIDIHTHTDSCYDAERNVICGFADFVVHTHNDSCYAEDGTLICPLDEIEAHTHDASCYQETRVSVCGLEERAGHIHDASCYQTAEEPACGLEESVAHVHEGHIHTEACYEVSEILICSQSEAGHTHTVECYETRRTLICTQDTGCYDAEGNLACEKTTEGHTHTVECYPEELICGKEETTAHAHTDDCYEIQEELVCGKEEIILHTHIDACFDENGNLTCGMLEVKEHIHDESCLPAPVEEANTMLQALSTVRNAEDLTPMITKINLQVQEGGYWVDLIGGTVEEGSSIRVRIEFTVRGGTLSDENRALYYQLPNGVRLNKQEQGEVAYNDGNPAGNYTIGTDGYIELVFNQDFPVEQDFSGYLQFEGTVAMLEGGDSESIEFGGSGDSIIIVPVEKELDLSIAKTGTYDRAANKIRYTITVSSENGTNGAPVYVGDWFQHDVSYGFISYDEDSLVVTKQTGGGSQNISLSTADILLHQQDAESAGWWNIQNLPALEPGEAYQITYTATPDLENSGDANGYLEFTNVAGAQSGGKTVNASAKVVVSQAMIQKVAEGYNPYTRAVTWTIYIRNPDGRDLAGEKLEDTMTFWPDGATGITWQNSPSGVTVAVGVYLPEDVNLNNKIDEFTLEGVSFPFEFPPGSVNSYSLTYTTVLPEELAGETGYFNNWAQFLGYEVHVGMTLEIPGLIGYDVTKNFWGDSEITDADGDTVTTLTWGSVVTYPEGAVADNLLYVDLIADAVTATGETIPNSHYTTPEALISGVVHVVPLVGSEWGESLQAGTDYTLYVLLKEDQPAWITSESFGEADISALQSLNWYTYNDILSMIWGGTISETTPISMLGVELTESGVAKLEGNPMVIQYLTVLDTKNLPAGTVLTAANLARIPTKWTYATYEKKFMDRLDKQVSFTGPNMETGDVSAYGDTTTGQIGPDGILYYRILLTDFLENGDGGAQVTDILPAGAKLVEDSVYLAAHDPSADIVQNGYVWNSYYIEYAATPGDNGETVVTFTLSRLGDLKDFDVIGIYYAVSVANDPVWDSQESKNYVNTAVWGNETDSTSTTVTHELPVVKKTGDQLTLDDGSPTNIVRYYVVVNPGEQQFMDIPGSALTLTDTLTIPEGVVVQFLLENVGVYHYDPLAEHGIGTPLESEAYTIQYDDERHVLTVELPDATACVVVYDYQVDRGESDIVHLTVNNTAVLEGYAATGSAFEIEVEEQSSSAGVNTANLIIYKVNSENNAELLNGALFSLERYTEQVQGDHAWEKTSITAKGPDGLFITGGDGPTGQIILSFLAGEGNTRYETIYRLQEVLAPSGYQITDTSYYYFVWMRENTTKQQTIANMRAAFEETGIDPDAVHFIPYNANHSVYITNAPLTTYIRVIKQWRDVTDEPLTNGLPESITLTLYQHLNGESVPYGNSVTLGADENGNWSYTWEDLPKRAEGGDAYTYTVEETPMPGYEASYVYPGNENGETGIAEGDITVINSKTNSFVLPETGGAGSTPLVSTGLLLAGMSGVGYLYFRQKRRKGGHAH